MLKYRKKTLTKQGQAFSDNTSCAQSSDWTTAQETISDKDVECNNYTIILLIPLITHLCLKLWALKNELIPEASARESIWTN